MGMGIRELELQIERTRVYGSWSIQAIGVNHLGVKLAVIAIIQTLVAYSVMFRECVAICYRERNSRHIGRCHACSVI